MKNGSWNNDRTTTRTKRLANAKLPANRIPKCKAEEGLFAGHEAKMKYDVIGDFSGEVKKDKVYK